MKIVDRKNLHRLLDFGYTKCGRAYRKNLVSFENGDVVIQIIINPYRTDDEVILNTYLDGIEITGERELYFCEEYHINALVLMREIQLLQDLEIINFYFENYEEV